jgi:RNA polymerase sigma-70 factor (ECF subfamily)
MLETSASLLERARAGPDAEAWRRLVDLYTPLLQAWIRRYALQHSDAEDIVQEVLGTLARELPAFRYDPQRGAFRSWLRAILVHRLQAFFRSRQSRPQPAGGSDGALLLEQFADPASDLSRLWDQEHDRHVAHRLLAAIQPDFEPTTWRAFQRTTLDGIKPAIVAAELGMSVNAVFIAKSRVLRRLRKEMHGLVE